MDSSRLGELRSAANEVFERASKPGGSLDQGTFTLSAARKQISATMGLGRDGLDDQEWRAAVKSEVYRLLNHSDNETEAGPSNQSSPKADHGKKQGRRAREEHEPAKSDSESEMSSVYDVPPSRKRKSEAESKGKRRRKSSKKGAMSDADESIQKSKPAKKSIDEGLSPEEAKVAELKRYVVACGVRKQWSKEFADKLDAKSQIRHLQSLLTSLGMKGQPTLGKAKTIKERRELAAELDDVKQFEAERGISSEMRPRRSKPKKSFKESDPEDDDEDEGTADAGDKKEASKSIMDGINDLLADQSDSD